MDASLLLLLLFSSTDSALNEKQAIKIRANATQPSAATQVNIQNNNVRPLGTIILLPRPPIFQLLLLKIEWRQFVIIYNVPLNVTSAEISLCTFSAVTVQYLHVHLAHRRHHH